MAPKVQVPCDFGREYINVPEHCNLTLKLQNGEDYLVNSVLMSYNSPEIKRLTTELHQTSLAMDDFDEKAVYCFVDALYSGEIMMLDKDMFTDVFKMGQVFEVSWLLNRLSDYFENLVIRRDTVNSSSNHAVYRNVKSLYDMAITILSQGSKKQPMFMDIFINSLTEKGDKSEFVTRLISEIDLNNLSKSRVEQILQMVGDESVILVEGLLKSFRNHPYNRPLSEELKFLLKSNLTGCYQKRRESFNELFDVLDGIESLTKDDLRFLNRINRQCMNEISDNIGFDSLSCTENVVQTVNTKYENKGREISGESSSSSKGTSRGTLQGSQQHMSLQRLMQQQTNSGKEGGEISGESSSFFTRTSRGISQSAQQHMPLQDWMQQQTYEAKGGNISGQSPSFYNTGTFRGTSQGAQQHTIMMSVQEQMQLQQQLQLVNKKSEAKWGEISGPSPTFSTSTSQDVQKQMSLQDLMPEQMQQPHVLKKTRGRRNKLNEDAHLNPFNQNILQSRRNETQIQMVNQQQQHEQEHYWKMGTTGQFFP